MRLFVALSPPAGTREHLADWAARVVGETPGTRRVPPRNLHVTLRFLGVVDAASLAGLAGVLDGVARRHSRLRLRLTAPGVVPPRGRARLGYFGIEASPELERLRTDVASGLEKLLGLERDTRPFRPHVTLARCRPAWQREMVDRWKSARWPHRERAFEVTYVELMESRLSPSGAEYHAVDRVLLEA